MANKKCEISDLNKLKSIRIELTIGLTLSKNESEVNSAFKKFDTNSSNLLGKVDESQFRDLQRYVNSFRNSSKGVVSSKLQDIDLADYINAYKNFQYTIPSSEKAIPATEEVTPEVKTQTQAGLPTAVAEIVGNDQVSLKVDEGVNVEEGSSAIEDTFDLSLLDYENLTSKNIIFALADKRFTGNSNLQKISVKKFTEDIFNTTLIDFNSGEVKLVADIEGNNLTDLSVKEYKLNLLKEVIDYLATQNTIVKTDIFEDYSKLTTVSGKLDYLNYIFNNSENDNGDLVISDVNELINSVSGHIQDLVPSVRKLEGDDDLSKAYVSLVNLMDFDAMLKAYKSTQKYLMLKDGEYHRTVSSNLKEGVLFNDDAVISFDAEASELFKVLVSNTKHYIDGKERGYLDPRQVANVFHHIYKSPRWKAVNPMLEMIDILKHRDYSVSSKFEESILESIYTRFFNPGEGKEVSLFKLTQDPTNKKLIGGLMDSMVNALQNINPQELVNVEADRGKLTVKFKGDRKTGTKARFIDNLNQMLINNYETLNIRYTIKSEKDKVTITDTNNNKSIVLKPYDVASFDQAWNLITSLTGVNVKELKEVALSLADNQKEFKQAMSSVAFNFFTSVKLLKEIQEGKETAYQATKLNLTYKDKVNLDEVVELVQGDTSVGDFTELQDLLSPVKDNMGSYLGTVGEAISVLSTVIPRLTNDTVEGTQKASISVHNGVSDIYAKVNRINDLELKDSSSFQPYSKNPLLKRGAIDKIWMRGGVKGFTDAKTHRKQNISEIGMVELNYDYLQQLRTSKGQKASFSMFNPADKNSDPAIMINRKELGLREEDGESIFSADSIKKVKDKHFESLQTYYLGLEANILADYKEAFEYLYSEVPVSTVTKLEDLIGLLDLINSTRVDLTTNKLLEPLVFSDILAHYYNGSKNHKNYYEGVHFDDKGNLNSELLKEIKVYSSETVDDVDAVNAMFSEFIGDSKDKYIKVSPSGEVTIKVGKVEIKNPEYPIYEFRMALVLNSFVNKSNDDLVTFNNELYDYLSEEGQGSVSKKLFNQTVSKFGTRTEVNTSGSTDIQYTDIKGINSRGEINPAFERFFWEWNYISGNANMLLHGGTHGFKGANSSKKFIESIKRMNGPVATTHTYSKGIPDGVPARSKTIILEEFEEIIPTLRGGVSKFDSWDGASISNLLSMREKQNSLGKEFGQIAGIHHKSLNYAHDVRTGAYTLEKHNDFAMTMEWVRNSKGLKKDLYAYYKGMLSSVTIDFTPNDEQRAKFKTLKYDVATNTVVEVGLQDKIYTNFYEMWEDLGSAYNVIEDKNGPIEVDGVNYRYVDFELTPVTHTSGNLKGLKALATDILVELKTEDYLDKLNELVANSSNHEFVNGILTIKSTNAFAKVESVDELRQRAIDSSIKESYVETLAMPSAVKSGRTQSASEQDVKDGKAKFQLIDNQNKGIQLKSEKDFNDKEGTLSTQLIGAISFKGLSEKDAIDVYETLKALALKKLKDSLGSFELTDANKDDFIKIAAEKLMLAQETRDISTTASAIINEFEENLTEVPFDNSQMIRSITATLNSFLSEEAIRNQISGLQLVLTPPVGVIQVEMDGEQTAFTREDFERRVYSDLAFAQRMRDDLNTEEVQNLDLTLREDLTVFIEEYVFNYQRDLNPPDFSFYENGWLTSVFQSSFYRNITEAKESGDKMAYKKAELELEKHIKALSSKVDREDYNPKNRVTTAKDSEGNVLYTTKAGEMLAPPVFAKKFGLKYGQNVNSVDLEHFKKVAKANIEKYQAKLDKLKKKLAKATDLALEAKLKVEINTLENLLDEAGLMNGDSMVSASTNAINTYAAKMLESYEYHLQSINARIPLQSLASVMKMEIVGFLYSMKNSAMVNSKHQMLTGGDFDVDKTNHMQQFVNELGVISKFHEGQEIADLSTYDVDYTKVIENIDSLSEGAVKNYITYKLMRVADSPLNLKARDTEVSMTDIEDIAKLSPKGKKDATLSPLDPMSRWSQKKANYEGKDVISIIATGIKALAALTTAYHETFKKIKELSSGKTKVFEQSDLNNLNLKNIKFKKGEVEYLSFNDYLSKVYSSELNTLNKGKELKARLKGKLKSTLNEQILNSIPDYFLGSIKVEDVSVLLNKLNMSGENAQGIAAFSLESGRTSEYDKLVIYDNGDEYVFFHELMHLLTVPYIRAFQQGKLPAKSPMYDSVKSLFDLYEKSKKLGYNVVNGESINDNVSEFAVNITNESSVNKLKRLGLFNDYSKTIASFVINTKKVSNKFNTLLKSEFEEVAALIIDNNPTVKKQIEGFTSSNLTNVSNKLKQAVDNNIRETDSLKVVKELVDSLRIDGVRLGGKDYLTLANLNYDLLVDASAASNEVLEQYLTGIAKGRNTTELREELELSDEMFDVLGQLLNAATDNAKHLYLDKINAGVMTSSIYVTLATMGVPVSEVASVLINPAVDAALKLSEKNVIKGGKFVSVPDAVERLMLPAFREKSIKSYINPIADENKKAVKALVTELLSPKSDEEFEDLTIDDLIKAYFQAANNKRKKGSAKTIEDLERQLEGETDEDVIEKIKESIESVKNKEDFDSSDASEYEYSKIQGHFNGRLKAARNKKTDKIKVFSSAKDTSEDLSGEDSVSYFLYTPKKDADTTNEFRQISMMRRIYNEHRKQLVEDLLVENIVKSNYGGNAKAIRSSESRANLEKFLELYELAQEFKIMGQSFGINSGLAANEFHTYRFKTRVDNWINKKMDEFEDVSVKDLFYKEHGVTLGEEYEKFDFFRWIEDAFVDGEYSKNWIKIMNLKHTLNGEVITSMRKGYNMLHVFKNNPQFLGQFKTMVLSSNWGKSLSYKIRDVENVIDMLSEEGMFNKNNIKEAEFFKIYKMMDEVNINDYFKQANIKIKIPFGKRVVMDKVSLNLSKGESLDLGDVHQREMFIEWVNQAFFPLLKLKFPDNDFMKNVTLSYTRKDGFDRRYIRWALNFDANLMSTDYQTVFENGVREGLKELYREDFKVDDQLINPMMIIAMYNRAVNFDGMSSDSFTRYLPHVKEMAEFNKKYWTLQRKERDTFSLKDKLTHNGSLSKNGLIYLQAKYRLVKYYPPYMLDSVSDAVFQTTENVDGKTKTVLKVKIGDEIQTLNPNSRFLDFTSATSMMKAFTYKALKQGKVYASIEKATIFIQELEDLNIITDC